MTQYTTSRFSPQDRVLSILYLSLLKDLLSTEGHKLEGYSGSAGHLSNHRKHVTLNEFCTILEQTMEQFEGSGLGIHYGRQLNMAAASTVGQLLMSCATINQAFDKFLRFSPLLSLSMEVVIGREGPHHAAHIQRLFCSNLSEPLQHFLTEAVLSCWLHQARWLSGRHLNYHKVRIAYPRPPNGHLYERMFGCEVEFDYGHHCVIVEDEFLHSKVITACEPVRKLKENHCSAALHRLEKKMPLRERINTMLSRTAPDIPDMDRIAENLNISRSTLYRKLNSANTSYQKIVDDFRCKMALNYLKTTSMPLHEIAEAMGFSDASNFRRAFKKWTGLAPSAAR